MEEGGSRKSGFIELVNRLMTGRKKITEEEIHDFIEASEEEGLVNEEESEMIRSIFSMRTTVVREIMVPRTDMACVSVEAKVRELLDTIIGCGHSRIPVYEQTIDNIIGLLYAKDLLKCWGEQEEEVRVRAIMRPPYFIPETKNLEQLLQEFKRKRVHLAIVIDEYGGTAGIVTIEDILEEIVGEIQDEYDQAEELEIQPDGDNEWLINARANLGDINDVLHVRFPVDDADTLGGFIYTQLGKIPLPGDEVNYENVRLKVVNVAGRRIGKVKVQVINEAPASSEKNEE